MIAVRRRKQKNPRHVREHLLFVVLPLLVLGFVAAGLTFESQREAAVDLNADLCPADELIAARAAFLVDLGKPLHATLDQETGRLLRNISLDLAKGTELRVFGLIDDPENPRVRLGRFCKPYDNADLQPEGAKDRAGSLRDCDDLPAQLSDSVRAAAMRFCDLRAALKTDINDLASGRGRSLVTGAWLVEAFEATQLELVAHPGSRLYVYSDMLQHAKWYSHLDLHWTDWRLDEFEMHDEARPDRPDALPAPMADMQVKVFYAPRQQRTAVPRLKRIHQRFWRDYFAPSTVTFEEQPMLPNYAVAPQMDLLTEAERVDLEQERLEQEIEATERLITRIEAERAALEGARGRRQPDAEQGLEGTDPLPVTGEGEGSR